jgi:protein TonB
MAIFHQNSDADQGPTQSIKAHKNRATVQGVKKVSRYAAVLPVAAVATVGLTLSMAHLIATEFTPQDKVEVARFEINPLVIEIDDFVKTEVKPIREVEVPPPPPTTGVIKTAEVKLPKIDVIGKKNEFKRTDIIFDNPINIHVDKEDPTPLVRILPVFPNRFLQGNVSGYCKIRFDISPEGQPMNIQTTLCTNSQLKSAAVKSVQKWKYSPRIQNGRPVSRSGLETTIRFDLRDERGNVLPLPSGF